MRLAWLLSILFVHVPYNDFCRSRGRNESCFAASAKILEPTPLRQLRLSGGGLRRSSAPINFLNGEIVETGIPKSILIF